MADTVLSGRWRVYYGADNRQQRIERDTSVTPTTIDTVNQLYSALQDLFDELTQMDDGVPMSAQTPTEYTLGIIDAGAKDPWFIDRTSVQYLKGGAIKTASWKRDPLVGNGTGTVGIVRIKYTATTNLDATDIGRDILMTTDGDRGTILDFNDTGATKFMWIRPDDNTVTHSFDNSLTDGGAFTIPNDSLGQVWNVVASGPTYADETADANEGTANDWAIFPAGTNTEANYALIGYRQKFKKFVMNVGTAGAGTYTVPVANWQYWNGAWTSLAGVTDGTNGFKTAGTNNVTFTVPTDWVATSLNGSASLYYIRALKDTGTVTTAPLGTQGFIGSTGATLAQVNIAGGGSAVTGESLWANVFTIGTIESNTHIYINQNAAVLNSYKDSTQDWWDDGQIDILTNVKEVDTEVDEGVIQVFARQHTKTFDNFEVDLTNGGRNPIPLSTGNDLDNQVGYRSLTMSGDSGIFNVEDRISNNASTPRAIITAVTGTSPTRTLVYYLIGDPIVDFADTETVTNLDDTGTGTVNGAPTNVNASTFTNVTVTHGNNTTFDIDENDTTETYSTVVTVSTAPDTRPLSEIYQRLKYITRRGETSTTSTDGIEAQFYIGSDRALTYEAQTANFAEGLVVTGGTSGAKGTIVADKDDGATGRLILRNTRKGATTDFTAGETITDTGTGSATISTGGVRTITPTKAAPFGTFAGGKFFGAPGVVINPSDIAAADASNYQLIDDTGTVIKPPTKVTVKVDNTKQNDKVAVFRLTAAAGSIKKDKYNATAQAAGVASVIVSGSIAVDEPGKTSPGGVLRLVDASANKEYRLRFTSWSASTFTLFTLTGLTADAAGGDADTLVDTGANFVTNAVKVGDLIRNTTQSEIAYVTAVTNENTLQTTALSTGNWNSDAYEIGTLPVATTTTPQDTVYVPLVDSFETADGDETATVTFSANIPVLVRARRAGPTNPILPFEQESTVTNTGMTVSIIRTSDTIFT